MTVQVINSDAREALAAMPAGSVHCAISSPPYWSLRDYGLEPVVWGGDDHEHEWGEEMVQGQRGKVGDASTLDGGNQRPESDDGPQAARQGAFCRRCPAWRGSLGLEPTPELYVEHIVQVMRLVRRVLRDDGTLWLNLGDSYTRGGRREREPGKSKLHPAFVGDAYADGLRPDTPPGLKPKDLVGIPWRVAFALQADGWYLRSDIVWAKLNPMPESVTDRPTRSHEYVFLLSKSARYYYDADAIREPGQDWGPRDRSEWRARETGIQSGGKPHTGCIDGDFSAGRNRRSVWEIATQPYPGGHFAVFPEKLVEPCILAGTSERGCCPECGARWERVGSLPAYIVTGSQDGPKRQAGAADELVKRPYKERKLRLPREDRGWCPTCDHDAEPVACRVLDPFAGSGTVGLVAERLGRHSILIDASEDYCRMARERTAQIGLVSAEAAR